MAGNHDQITHAREALRELRTRHPVLAMESVDAVLEEFLALQGEEYPEVRALAANGEPSLYPQPPTTPALRAARRLLLGFCPTSRLQPASDDCSDQALAAYAAFAAGLRADGEHGAEPTTLALAQLIDEWVAITQRRRSDDLEPDSWTADWDLANVLCIVHVLEQFYARWLPGLRQQIFRVRYAK